MPAAAKGRRGDPKPPASDDAVAFGLPLNFIRESWVQLAQTGGDGRGLLAGRHPGDRGGPGIGVDSSVVAPRAVAARRCKHEQAGGERHGHPRQRNHRATAPALGGSRLLCELGRGRKVCRGWPVVGEGLALLLVAERLDHGLRRGWPIAGLLRQQPNDQVRECRRDGRVHTRGGRGLLCHNRNQRGNGIAAAERHPASAADIEHAPQAEEVGAAVHRLALRLFRRHECRRPDDHPRIRQTHVLLARPCQSEIEDLDAAFGPRLSAVGR